MNTENPINEDRVTTSPGLLPYANHVGSPAIKPLDKGKIKGRAVSAMWEQTQMQMDQIRQQIELLAEQARAIQNRMEISEKIYLAEMSFEPLIGREYHLYERKNGSQLLSMVGPKEWGRSFPFSAFLASVKLLSDHTWEITLQGEKPIVV